MIKTGESCFQSSKCPNDVSIYRTNYFRAKFFTKFGEFTVNERLDCFTDESQRHIWADFDGSLFGDLFDYGSSGEFHCAGALGYDFTALLQSGANGLAAVLEELDAAGEGGSNAKGHGSYG